jgi:hypothetical protein
MHAICLRGKKSSTLSGPAQIIATVDARPMHLSPSFAFLGVIRKFISLIAQNTTVILLNRLEGTFFNLKLVKIRKI